MVRIRLLKALSWTLRESIWGVNVIEENGFDRNELLAVLNEASQDPQLLNFGFWVSGWKEQFEKLNLTRASRRLAEILESPFFSIFNDRMFYSGNGGSTVNIGLLSNWLATRTIQAGAEEAVSGLLKLVELKEKPELDILLLSGIRISREYQIDDWFKLVPLSSIWKYSIDHFGQYLSHSRETFQSTIPTAALITVRQVSTSIEPSRVARDRLILDYTNQDLFWLTLGLICTGEAPTPMARWNLLPSWVPFSGILDSGYSSRMEIKHPKGENSLGDTEIKHSIKLYESLKTLPPSIIRPLTICLNRLNQSVNTWDLVQQAIDLGVALEAVLTPSENTDQLSFQFRLLGALLVGDTQNERLLAYDIFKSFYTLRSKAVHNGELPTKSIQISGMGKLTPREVLIEATRLGRLAVIKLIERGGIAPDEYANFILSSGGRYQN